MVLLGLGTIAYLKHKVDKLNAELSIANNNAEYYADMFGNIKDKSRTLQLTIEQLHNSNDSLISKLVEVKEKLKIKDKNLQHAQIVQVNVDTVVVDTILTKEVYFTKELKLNDLTTITVSRVDSLVTVKLNLTNQQLVYIEEKKEYRRKYRNWFKRLLKFDFKRDKVRRVTVENTNDLIKVTDTRIIDIK